MLFVAYYDCRMTEQYLFNEDSVTAAWRLSLLPKKCHKLSIINSIAVFPDVELSDDSNQSSFSKSELILLAYIQRGHGGRWRAV